jgi:hypothetical protein
MEQHPYDIIAYMSGYLCGFSGRETALEGKSDDYKEGFNRGVAVAKGQAEKPPWVNTLANKPLAVSVSFKT